MNMIEKKLLTQMQLYPNAETRIFRFCDDEICDLAFAVESTFEEVAKAIDKLFELGKLEFAYSEGPSHERCGFMLVNTKEREDDLVSKRVLDRTSIRVLKKLNNFEHSSSKTWVFGDDALLPVMESIGIDQAEFDKCIRFLEGKGYIKCDGWDYPYKFELSYKGVHYEEFIKLEALKNEL